jgi:hypothetical protein
MNEQQPQQEEKRRAHDLLAARLSELDVSTRMTLLVGAVFENVAPQTAHKQLAGLVALVEMLTEELTPATRSAIALAMVAGARRLDSDAADAHWH